MKELMKYFRDSGEKFGNPDVIELDKPAAFDLRWEANPPLALRWTWDDPGALRRDPNESFFLGAVISGAHDHDAHVELSDPSHPWLYVSTRYKDFRGKVAASKIVRCFTKEGEWMKQALEAGKKYLEKLR